MDLRTLQTEKADGFNVIDNVSIKSVEGPDDTGQYKMVADHGKFGVKIFAKDKDNKDLRQFVGKTVTIAKAAAKFNDKGYIAYLSTGKFGANITESKGGGVVAMLPNGVTGPNRKSVAQLEDWISYWHSNPVAKACNFDPQQIWAAGFSCWKEGIELPPSKEDLAGKGPDFSDSDIPF